MKTIVFTVMCLFATGFMCGANLVSAQVVEKPVTVVKYIPVYRDIKQGKYFGFQRDMIAATIPASALTPPAAYKIKNPKKGVLTHVSSK